MSEDVLKRACRKIANEFKQEHPDDFWFYFPTDHFVSGIPDALCCYRGLWGACELKTMRGKVTALQDHTLKNLEKAGAVISVARSVDEFRAFLQNLKKKGGQKP